MKVPNESNTYTSKYTEVPQSVIEEAVEWYDDLEKYEMEDDSVNFGETTEIGEWTIEVEFFGRSRDNISFRKNGENMALLEIE